MNMIETRNLTKLFGSFYANREISFAVKQGEIRAIIGENGAGKSTLMNMLYGLLQPSAGEILVRGEPVSFHSSKDAIDRGIGMVHQHFKLVPSLTVYENIMLGAELCRGPFIDYKRERQVIGELIAKHKFDLNVDDVVDDLSMGARQRVEILKMLYRNVDILILDEPTSVLTPQEVDVLIENLLELQREGKTILVITHKLQEVKQLADTITVIRHGRLIGTVETAAVSMEELARMMVGRPVLMQVEKGPPPANREQVYAVEGLCVKGRGGRDLLEDVSLQVRSGEILGIAGIEGNGQSELFDTLAGMVTASAGKVTLLGKDLTNQWPDVLRRSGMAIMPGDRWAQGLCREMRVSHSLIAGYHRRPAFCGKLMMKKKQIREHRDKLVKEYDIRLSAPDPETGGLSGGNAQKVVVARELSSDPDFLLCCQPTAGVDVGSIEGIHRNLVRFRDSGKAILLISSDLGEVMSLSDRILVMYKGEFTGEFQADSVSAQELGLYMTGAKRDPVGNKQAVAAGGGGGADE